MSSMWFVPFYGRYYKARDYAREVDHWNRDFIKNTGRKVKYSMISGKNAQAAYADAVQQFYSGTSQMFSVGRKTSKYYRGGN